MSFHPIIDLLKNWARIREDDGEAAAWANWKLPYVVVCSDETDEVLPFLATMMGMKLAGKHAKRVRGIEGEALEKLIFKNVRELLIKSTEIMPTVIVMEDVHWADTSSLLLMESLCRLALTQRIVFMNVFRPGYRANAEATIETLKDRIPNLFLVEIVIQPLDQDDSEALINNMLNIKGLFHHGLKDR